MFRAGLVNRLRAARAPVIVIAAPAGYGKTTLVEQWASRDDRTFARCELTEHDDAASVVRKVAAAAPVGRAYVDAAVDRTIAAVAQAFALHGESAIVLEGADRITDADACRALATLAQALPVTCLLVLVGRGQPPLPLARLRVRGALLELGVDDLRFSDREAAALFEAEGVNLSPGALRTLNRQVLGWVLGLRLAARSRGASTELPDSIRRELLARLDEDERRFLTRAAVLDPLTAPLCEVVTATPGAHGVLERLERGGCFVLPLDRERRSYCIHPSVRAALLVELERREPGAAPLLRARASDWCAGRCDVDAALSYASAAGDRTRMVELIGGSMLPFSSTATAGMLESWLAEIDDERVLGRHPAAAAAGAAAHALAGRPEAALRWAAIADGAGPRWRTLLRVLLGGGRRLRADAEEALAAVDADDPWRIPALLALGEAARLDGSAETAEEAFALAEEEADARGLPRLAALALALRSLAASAAGAHERADALAAKAATCALGVALARDATIAAVHIAGARAALPRGDWERVRSCVEAAQTAVPRLTHALGWLSAELLLELASVQCSLGEAADARASLARAEDVLARGSRPAGRFVRRARELRVRLAELETAANGPVALTAAELRLLPLLTTHLSFREIADQLFVSRNTVKTQAISVYRKLGVSARDEAIGKAVARGLMGEGALQES